MIDLQQQPQSLKELMLTLASNYEGTLFIKLDEINLNNQVATTKPTV